MKKVITPLDTQESISSSDDSGRIIVHVALMKWQWEWAKKEGMRLGLRPSEFLRVFIDQYQPEYVMRPKADISN